MLENDLIIVMFNIPWEWSTDYTNQTAYELSNRNNKVICYMITEMRSLKEYLVKRKIPKIFEKKNSSLYVYWPIHFLPFRRFQTIANFNNALNIFLVKALIIAIKLKHKLNKSYVWVFDPTYYDLYMQFGKQFILIYDCVDYFAGGRLDQEAYYREVENRLLQASNYVFTVSQTLKNIHSKLRKDIYLVPQGFRFEHFKKQHKLRIQLPHGSPIVGYVGGINFRLDYSQLINIALQLPHVNFVFVGPIQKDFIDKFEKKMNKLFNLKNVYYIGNRPKHEVPAIINKFSIGIIPYSALIFNRYSYPMKLFEYFYMGKPVVATYITELKRFSPLVTLAADARAWKKVISNLLAKKWPAQYKQQQRNLAIENSWQAKIEKMSQITNL